jgi:hypothetical protein
MAKKYFKFFRPLNPQIHNTKPTTFKGRRGNEKDSEEGHERCSKIVMDRIDSLNIKFYVTMSYTF